VFWNNKFEKSILASLARIEAQGVKLMSGLTDLQAVVTGLQTELTTLQGTIATAITDLQAAQSSGDSDAAVEAAAQSLQTVLAGLTTINSNLGAALPTPPAPPAAPTP